MKRFLRNYVLLFCIASLVVIIDQYSKAWIRTNLEIGAIWSPWEWLTPYIRIVHWYNTGVVFGMFQGQGQLFTILSICVAVAILYFFPSVPKEDWALRLAMSLQFGGAIGNLIDRLVYGHVTDFISVGKFPVFNLADASITISVGILVLGIWLQEKEKKARTFQGVAHFPISDSSSDRGKIE